jgi:hypothetical protein
VRDEDGGDRPAQVDARGGVTEQRADASLSGLLGPSRARNAAATTTVGSTNGTITPARSSARPRNRSRANT